jgi:hypothetical protein
MSTKTNTKDGSVASQQKSCTEVQFPKLTNGQLHKRMLEVRNDFYNRCVETQDYAVHMLLPACIEVIARYKMQGVAAKDRPNGKPTVEAYFRSIKLNYNTVRSWIHRKRLSTEMFDPEKRASNNRDGKTPHLTQLEAKLLGNASAANNLLLANKHGGNVEEEMKALERCGFTPQRVEEYIERPVKVATTEVEKMAVRLCKLIDKNDDKHGQKILALARELLTKVEPTTVQQVLAEENTWQQREARKKMPQSEKTAFPSRQTTNGVARRAQ